MTLEQGKQISELYRRINNMIRVGTIAKVDYATARAQVQIGKITTGYLPWLTPSTSAWIPIQPGEQVIVLSPNGNLGFGVILPALYQDAKPAPSSDTNKITIVADIEQTGNKTLTGTLSTDSTITASGEITGNGVKLSAHTHEFQYVGAGQGSSPQTGSTKKPS